jgi:hypothetical protein
MEGHGSKARCVALGAEHHDDVVGAGERCGASFARRIETPLEDVPLDGDGRGNDALAPALLRRADVDQQRASLHGGRCLPGVQATKPGPGLGDLTIDVGDAHGSGPVSGIAATTGSSRSKRSGISLPD